MSCFYTGLRHGYPMPNDELLLGEETIRLCDQDLYLDPLRAIYWKQKKMLILSDLHLGKAGHFRKNGIPVPRQVHLSDLENLSGLVEKYQPICILFLGDLFHSEMNEEWIDFVGWSAQHKEIRQVLVEGNHDILGKSNYEETAMEVVPDWQIHPFHFTHEPSSTTLYNLSGHIHPSIRLRGRARQGMTFPCFYFTENAGLFPAFGTFTGNFKIKPKKGDRVFAIAEGSVVALMS